MAETEGGSEQDDVSFLRTVSVLHRCAMPFWSTTSQLYLFDFFPSSNTKTKQEDMVCLSCTATGERVMLAAEGFGNRHCFLENIADKNIPPDLSQCVFVIEQALSVRALQELVTAAGSESVCFTCTHLKLQTHIHTFSVSVLRSRSPPLSLSVSLLSFDEQKTISFSLVRIIRLFSLF